ncbi:hypothetical protein F441_23051 [Phytophthora nicotianae CJ01A1]|uniref:Uncharacterized protein n=2 Tax=Phytophthora nicotianae TaxID=4792 RepID=W2HHS9_PHYNI|nr:hypothetical protein L915_02195 [Phytophthora nicotianae]ETL48208.1 hypothetical protein L916_02156 [Phytophthora nicotianae]ETO99533.1 hypothetical protein F441_23051 [Phytophthora nicotianae CJ01A1]
MVGTRGSAPITGNDVAPDTGAASATFKSVREVLTAEGWTSKASTGIETLWKYVKPGRDPNGTEGVDYLLREQAVLNYALDLVREETVERVRTAQAALNSTDVVTAPATEPVQVSLPPATKLPKKPATKKPKITVGEVPATAKSTTPATKKSKAPTPSMPKSSQASTSTPSKSATLAAEPTDTSSAQTSSTSQRVVSDPTRTTAGFDSHRSQDVAESAQNDQHSTIDIIGDDDDGNINTDPNGNMDYHVLDSGSESEGDDLSQMDERDSDSTVSDSIDEEDEELYDPEERFSAGKFLNSIGGHEKVLAGEGI